MSSLETTHYINGIKSYGDLTSYGPTGEITQIKHISYDSTGTLKSDFITTVDGTLLQVSSYGPVTTHKYYERRLLVKEEQISKTDVRETTYGANGKKSVESLRNLSGTASVTNYYDSMETLKSSYESSNGIVTYFGIARNIQRIEVVKLDSNGQRVIERFKDFPSPTTGRVQPATGDYTYMMSDQIVAQDTYVNGAISTHALYNAMSTEMSLTRRALVEVDSFSSTGLLTQTLPYIDGKPQSTIMIS